MHFDVNHHMYPYEKVGSTMALTRWDLSSLLMPQTALLSSRWPLELSYLQFVAIYLKAQSFHESRNQPQGIIIHELSLFGHDLGKILLGSISLYFGQRS